MPITATTTITIESLGELGDSLDVTVEFDPGHCIPAQTYGDPDDCYDEDSQDPEVLSVLYLDDSDKEHDGVSDLSVSEAENLMHWCWQHQQDLSQDLEDQAAEFASEHREFGY